MKISTKILGGYGVILVLMLLVSAVILLYLSRFNQILDLVLQSDDLIINAKTMERLVVDIETAQRGFLLTGQETFLGLYRTAATTFEKMQSELKNSVGQHPEQVARIETIEARVKDWQATVMEPGIAARIGEGKGTPMRQVPLELVHPASGHRTLESIRKSFDQFVNIEYGLMKDRAWKSQELASFIWYLTGILTLAAVSIGGFIGYYVSDSITRPLREFTHTLAEGNLQRGVTLKRRDEIGLLDQAIASGLETWRGIVETIADGATKLSTSLNQIAAATEEMHQGATSQVDQILKISSAMEEMSVSIQEVSRNAQSTSQAALAASKQAREGAGKVQKTVGGISTANETIKILHRRAQEIGKVVQLIREIAAQTNILALNAAIEAARAGEHGRGFDVVAEEIRKLAQRTTHSTEEIAASIVEIQRDTQEAARVMEAGTTMANETGQTFEDIVQGIVSTTDMVQMISTSAIEQAKTSEEMADALQRISMVSQQTAQGTREMAKATQDLSTVAEELREITGQFTR